MKFSRRSFLGGGAVVVVGTTVFLNSVQSQPADTPGTMTPAQAYAAVTAGTLILIDIRRPDEWRATGIAKGAIPIDMRRDDFADAVAAQRGQTTLPIAVICARGVRSRRTTAALEGAGFNEIIDVPEGMLGSRAGPGWIASALPIDPWDE